MESESDAPINCIVSIMERGLGIIVRNVMM